jgi:hypothetical protein
VGAGRAAGFEVGVAVGASAISLTGAFTGTGGFGASEAIRTFGGFDATGAETFCAETTPKAASPKLKSPATTITNNRIATSLRNTVTYAKVKAQSASESTSPPASTVKDASCGFRGTGHG